MDCSRLELVGAVFLAHVLVTCSGISEGRLVDTPFFRQTLELLTI